jgi:DNA invertase Pin-like site-specific DNA recombinase
MSGKLIGYIRVSTADQNPERQLEGIKLDKAFIEHASAKNLDRPQLKSLIDYVRDDDVIIVHSMDRLARNLTDLKNLVDNFIKRGIEVKFVKENISFTKKENAISNLTLSLMGAFAEFEYAMIRERQAEGIRIARMKGKYKGRKKKLDNEKIEILRERLKTREKRADIAKSLGISKQGLYNYINKLGLIEPIATNI